MEEKVCCLCGSTFRGWGNNPWPVPVEGRCCDRCNSVIVIPARLAMLVESKEKEKKVEK